MMYNRRDPRGNACLHPCMSQLYTGVRLQMFTASNSFCVASAHLLHRQGARPHVSGGCVRTKRDAESVKQGLFYGRQRLTSTTFVSGLISVNPSSPLRSDLIIASDDEVKKKKKKKAK